MSGAVLALDNGTSSVRAACFDFRGRQIAGTFAQRAGILLTDGSGKAEINPAELLAATSECLDTARRSQVRAVAASCFWHSLLGVDAAGNPLTPVYTWADSRCRGDAAALRAAFDEREIHAETGCMLRASFWPAKLRWLRRTDKALFRRVAKWISPAEWLQWKLTGSATCSIGMATGTGLFDPTKLRWSERMLETCGIGAEKLLPISDAPTEWNGVPWFPGIGDGAASNLGSGACSDGLAAINVGTSAALRVMREGRVAKAPFGLFCYRVDSRRFLVGGAVSNAGNLYAWCRRELNLPADHAQIEKALARRSTPDHGLTVLPFWTAERAPRWNEEDTGAIFGLRQHTTAVDILQAVVEGFYYRLAAIAEEIARSRRGASPKWIVSGGGMKTRASLRRLANVLGESVYANPEAEASLRGAAIHGLELLGVPARQPKLGAPILPDAEIHARHVDARARQVALENLQAKLRE